MKTYLEFINENKNNKWVLAYHGTPHGVFNKFSIKKRGTGADISSVGDYGRGYYFTPSKDNAIEYATKLGDAINVKINNPTLYTVEIKMNKPFDMRIISKFQSEYLILARKYGMLNIPSNEFDDLYTKLGVTLDEYEFMLDIENSIGDNWGDWNIKNAIKVHGYDSLINYDGNEYIIYDSRNIRILKVESL